jgi:hypothetical protein
MRAKYSSYIGIRFEDMGAVLIPWYDHFYLPYQ